MSGHTKTPHTSKSEIISVVVFGKKHKEFSINRAHEKKVMEWLQAISSGNEALIPADEIKVFKELDKKYGKVGVMVRGGRVKEGLTQKELARKLNMLQTHISEIERGKRMVGKNLAHKLAKVFNVDYHLFL